MLGTSLALVLCWMVQAFGVQDSSAGLGRWLLLAWLVLAPVLMVAKIRQWARDPESQAPERKTRALTVAVLLAVALLVRLLGADHEVSERSYQDEGTYYHHATEINEGKPWRGSFVYGHVSYYAGAFGLWIAALFPQAFGAVAAAWSGTDELLAHQWLVLRVLVALLSAVTVLPVFGIAWLVTALPASSSSSRFSDLAASRLPLLAATTAGALFIASPVMNEGSHLIISDWPSACLATFSLFYVARILAADRNTSIWRDYALAGLFAGLAAATKYPAGTVAIAIPITWLVRAVLRRRGSVGRLDLSASKTALRQIAPLAIATFSAMAAFVAAMPTFLLDPHHAVFSPRGMLFGLRQYSGGGWIGVERDSNLGFYLSICAQSLGWIALLALVASPFALRGHARRRWLVMSSYALLYGGLLLTMSLALERNLAPIIPLLAALAGVGVAALTVRFTAAVQSTHGRFLAFALLALAVAWPASSTLVQTVSLTRHSTREVAAVWLHNNLPEGTRLMRESYTPRLDPDHFFLRRARFAARVPIEEIEADRYQYVLLAGVAFNRFLDDSAHTEEHHGVMAQRYREMFSRYEETKRWEPGRWRRGPTLILLRVEPRTTS